MQIGYYKKSGAENAISLLQGIDVGAQRYAQGKRYNDEQAQQQQQYDRQYGLRLGEDARQNQAQKNQNDEYARRAQEFPVEQQYRADANQRANDASQRAANEAPIQHALNQEELRGRRSTNDLRDMQAEWESRQQAFEAQVEADSHKQEQAQEYKNATGEDVPNDFWGDSSSGPSAGPGGHWSNYDPRSNVPIKTQIKFNKAASELSTLPPGSTRAQRAKALIEDTHNEVISSVKQSILDQMGKHVLPKQQPGGAQQEADPSLYIPEETYNNMQKLAKDPKTDPDELSKQWKTLKDSHQNEMAWTESRTLAVQNMDAHAQKLAQQQADYGDLVGRISSEQFEAFRKERYTIAEGNLHGPLLDKAVERAMKLLSPGPKPESDTQKSTSFEAQWKQAQDSAYANDPKAWPKMTTEQRTAETYKALGQMVAAKRAFGAQSGGGEMPGSPGGAPLGQSTRDQREAEIRANPEKFKGRFATREDLEKYLNGG
jgi:hypothetical protein